MGKWAKELKRAADGERQYTKLAAVRGVPRQLIWLLANGWRIDARSWAGPYTTYWLSK